MRSLETTSKTLRVIGQVLEKDGIDLFELRYNGDEYRLLCGDPEPPHLRLVEVSYFHEKIGALDAAAKNQRKERFTLSISKATRSDPIGPISGRRNNPRNQRQSRSRHRLKVAACP